MNEFCADKAQTGARKMRSTKLAHERVDDGLETKRTLTINSHSRPHSPYALSPSRSLHICTFVLPTLPHPEKFSDAILSTNFNFFDFKSFSAKQSVNKAIATRTQWLQYR
jgi:hypothetical protein